MRKLRHLQERNRRSRRNDLQEELQPDQGIVRKGVRPLFYLCCVNLMSHDVTVVMYTCAGISEKGCTKSLSTQWYILAHKRINFTFGGKELFLDRL